MAEDADDPNDAGAVLGPLGSVANREAMPCRDRYVLRSVPLTSIRPCSSMIGIFGCIFEKAALKAACALWRMIRSCNSINFSSLSTGTFGSIASRSNIETDGLAGARSVDSASSSVGSIVAVFIQPLSSRIL